MTDTHSTDTSITVPVPTETLVNLALLAASGSLVSLWAYCFTGWHAGLTTARPLLDLMLAFGIVAAGCLAVLTRRDEFA